MSNLVCAGGLGQWPVYAAAAAVIGSFWATTGRAQVLYSEDFNDSAAAGRWFSRFDSDNDITDFTADYAFNYSSLGIPAAPGGGGTIGARLDVNSNGLAGAAGVNIFPAGQSFSGDFSLRYNVYARVAGNTGQASEDFLSGINASGNNTDWFALDATSSDGVFYGVNGNGGNAGSTDYVRFVGNSTGNPTFTELFGNQDPLPQSTFPSSNGAPSNQWANVEISQIEGAITLKINGRLFDTYANNSGFSAGNIFLGHQDTTVDTPPNAQTYSIFDNVKVLRVARWTATTDSTWNSPSNWSAATPSGAGSIAFFGQTRAGTVSVTVPTIATVGQLIFRSSASSYTLTGAGGLALSDSSGLAALDVEQGNHSIAVPLFLATSARINVAAGSTLSVSNSQLAITGAALTKLGGGVLQMRQARADTLNIGDGTLRIAVTQAPNDPNSTSVVKQLSFLTDTAKLDLANSSMVIDYASGASPAAVIRQQLLSGNIFTSQATSQRKLGFIDNVSGAITSFAGVSVDPSSVLLKYTYAGDASLDGKVDIVDLGRLASNWQSSTATWAGGDFNYDGVVNIVDLGALAANWQAGAGSPLGTADDLQTMLAALGLPDVVGVPEPIAAAPLFALGLLMRRRRAGAVKQPA